MKENYARALARVLAYEGGKVNDPHDPGGRTNAGVTQSTYNAWLRSKNRMPDDVYKMAPADRDAIYREEYWDRVRGDDLPGGLDLCVFDAAVNSGVSQAAKWLQQTANITADGIVGSKTIEAVDAIVADHELDDMINGFCSRRLATLQRLTTWSRFGKGWHARIANVQKTALSWDGGGPAVAAPDLSGVGGSAKASISGLKAPVLSQATAHVATTASGAATMASQAAQQVQAVEDVFVWVKYVFGALTLVSVGAGVLAMVSKQAHDAAETGSAKATVDLEADTQLPSVPDVQGG